MQSMPPIRNTYDNFPLFRGWPSDKVFFLENMAWEQHFQQQYQQQHHHLHQQLQTQYSHPYYQQAQQAQQADSQQAHNQHEEDEVDQVGGSEDGQDTKHTVVLTDDMDDILHKCTICNQRFLMMFDQDEEEWVFDECKMYDGTVYHFPFCYEIAVKESCENEPKY
jgi:hypothetical protein